MEIFHVCCLCEHLAHFSSSRKSLRSLDKETPRCLVPALLKLTRGGIHREETTDRYVGRGSGEPCQRLYGNEEIHTQ